MGGALHRGALLGRVIGQSRAQRVSKKLTIGGMIESHRSMNSRPSYPTDLSDHEWTLIKHLVPAAKPGGRPEASPKREILHAMFSLLRSGCAWRMLPHDLPPWRIVYHDFRQWRLDGTWHVRHDLLRGDVRAAAGKPRQPSAGIVDRQSVKTTEQGGSAVMRRGSRCRAASAISSSIPSGYSST